VRTNWLHLSIGGSIDRSCRYVRNVGTSSLIEL